MLTVVILGVYAWDTRRIAEATVEQRNLTHRPCVVFAGLSPTDVDKIILEHALEVDPDPRLSGMREAPSLLSLPLGALWLENIGLGPALDVEAYRVSADGSRSERLCCAHCKVGQRQGLDPAPSWVPNERWSYEISYLGLSGLRFVSRYELSGGLVLKFSTFAAKKPTAL